MHPIKAKLGRVAGRPLSPELAAAIQPVKEAAGRLKRPVGRFEIYEFLKDIYRVYIDWKRRKIAKQSTRAIARELNIVRREGMSPIRILIEAIFPNVDYKQKSRWVRALEYVAYEEAPAKIFRRFIRARGGLAGCARLAAQVNRKRRRPRRDCGEGDWDDQE